METKLFLLYSTDEHHSRSSYNLIGVFDEKHKAVRAANEFDGYNITTHNLAALQENNQTQGLEINYLIETRILNQIS